VAQLPLRAEVPVAVGVALLQKTGPAWLVPDRTIYEQNRTV
jgi:hypothetical protein